MGDCAGPPILAVTFALAYCFVVPTMLAQVVRVAPQMGAGVEIASASVTTWQHYPPGRWADLAPDWVSGLAPGFAPDFAFDLAP